MSGLVNLFTEIISNIIDAFFYVFNGAIPGFSSILDNNGFNIYLFSEEGWFNAPIPLYFLVQVVVGLFIFIFLVRLLWKGTKKFITMIFGVFRV